MINALNHEDIVSQKKKNPLNGNLPRATQHRTLSQSAALILKFNHEQAFHSDQCPYLLLTAKRCFNFQAKVNPELNQTINLHISRKIYRLKSRAMSFITFV